MGSIHSNYTLFAGKFLPASAAFHMAQPPVVQELYADTDAEWISLGKVTNRISLLYFYCMRPNL
jgi:hypothetical protein